MSGKAPRHREEKSPAQRKRNGGNVLALIGILLLIWFAVSTDNVLLVTVSTIGALIGTWIGRRGKARRGHHTSKDLSGRRDGYRIGAVRWAGRFRLPTLPADAGCAPRGLSPDSAVG